MKQRWLPGFDYPDLDTPASALDSKVVVADEGAVAHPTVLPGQRGLFTVERELVGLMRAGVRRE